MPQPPAPLFSEESIYIGIDIGKAKHIAGFISASLLERHRRFDGCPTFVFSQSREGFHALLERIRSLAPREHCFVLMEQTGHYHKLVEQFLVELDLPVYVMHVQRRPTGLIKTDKRDALGLANHLYNLLAKGIQVGDKLQLVRRAFPPSEAAACLKSLTRHRYELMQESTQRKNQLTAIADELFPELTQICKDPNLPTPLALREAFPTPAMLAIAAFSAVKARRIGFRPSDANLARLQALARTSIGIKEVGRQQGLVFEQAQLIAELRVIQQHVTALEQEIAQVVGECREGQILRSIPAIGPLQAAAILATIGTIANFRSTAARKAYFGWAPTLTQSGTTDGDPISWSGRTDRLRPIGFKDDRAEIAQAGVPTLTVVKDLNVFKDRAPRLPMRLEVLFIQAFHFDTCPKALDHRVVIAIASTTHNELNPSFT